MTLIQLICICDSDTRTIFPASVRVTQACPNDAHISVHSVKAITENNFHCYIV